MLPRVTAATTNAVKAAATTAPKKKSSTGGGLPGSPTATGPFEAISGRRPISTVVNDTKFDKNGKVKDPGHIQFQTSQEEQERMPGLAPAFGHSPQHTPGQRRESIPVSGKFQDGTPFSVKGFRTDAKPVGADAPRTHPDSVYYHGEASDEQLRTLRGMQDKPVFNQYETSGSEGTNCVTGHAEVANRLGMNVDKPYQYARPQDLGEQMKGKRADGSDKS